jgi:pimeloyl-ACP methyl ester carboxylesterase
LYPKSFLARVDLVPLAEEVGRLIGRDLADSPSILIRQVKAMGRHDVADRLGELAGIPTRVIAAAEDPIALPRYGRELARLLPGARFEEIPGASHGVPLHLPALINDRLRSHIREAGELSPGRR